MPEWESAEREAYLALALVPGIGPARLRALLDRFASPSGALAAPFELLCSVPEISRAAATAIACVDQSATARLLDALHAEGGVLLLLDDAGFPDCLRDIPDPPTCLFARGNLALLSRPAVAIVGSRDHSHYGAEVCRRLARAAVEAGLVVVSGMARGLDAIAHTGALEGGGATIGVLGNGLGVVYPAANRQLYEAVGEQGLLITEFPPGERPRAGSFPRRNRLISGLARVIVVVEAASRSGALQTVACAHDQGREVMAVPGPITSIVSAGTNAMIRDGAGPLLDLQDLLFHYPEVVSPPARAVPDPGPRRPLEHRILNALQIEALPAEELIEHAGAPVVETLEMLSTLELEGKVTRQAGLYRLATAHLFA